MKKPLYKYRRRDFRPLSDNYWMRNRETRKQRFSDPETYRKYRRRANFLFGYNCLVIGATFGAGLGAIVGIKKGIESLIE